MPLSIITNLVKRHRTFSSLQEISGIITDAGLPPETIKQYEGAGVTML